MKPSAKTAKKSSDKDTVIDEYLPKNGNPGYQVSSYELDLEYKVSINRLSGSATITAMTLDELQNLTLDLSNALKVSKVSVNGKPAPLPTCGPPASNGMRCAQAMAACSESSFKTQ